MANERGRTKQPRAGAPRERFPDGRGEAAKRGDPPIEEPRGERSRHGRGGERPPADEEDQR